MKKVIHLVFLVSSLQFTTLQLHPMLRSRSLLQHPKISYVPPKLLAHIKLISQDLSHQHAIAPVRIRASSKNCSPDSLACYIPLPNSKKGAICFSKLYLDSLPTMQYVWLLHEFRHHIQNQNGLFTGRVSPKKIMNFYPAAILEKMQQHYAQKKQHTHLYYEEHDADLFAIHSLRCPLCVTVAYHFWNYQRQVKDGYIGTSPILRHIDTISQQPCCKAHKLTKEPARKLNKLLSNLETQAIEDEKKAIQICKLDHECGPIIKRHW